MIKRNGKTLMTMDCCCHHCYYYYCYYFIITTITITIIIIKYVTVMIRKELISRSNLNLRI